MNNIVRYAPPDAQYYDVTLKLYFHIDNAIFVYMDNEWHEYLENPPNLIDLKELT